MQEVSPSLPATIMMDEDLPGEDDDDMSSPHEYALASPHDLADMNDDHSPQSPSLHEATSDIEIDV